MFRYDPMPTPFRREPVFANAMSSLLGPTMAINQLQTDQAKRKLLEQETTRLQDRKNAMAQYQQTGDLGPVMQADPDMAMKVMDMMSKLSERDQKTIDQGIKFLDMALPMVNDPAQLAPLKEDLMKISPIMANRIPDPASFQSPEQFQGWYKNAIAGKEIIKESIKPESFSYHNMPVGENQIPIIVGNKTGNIRQLGEGGPRALHTPQAFEPKGGGPSIWVRPGEPIPENYVPAKQFAGSVGEENIEQLVEGIKRGDVVPSQLSKRALDYNKIIARLAKDGVKITDLQNQYEGAKRFVGSLNNQQMIRFKGLAGSVQHTIDRTNELAQQMDLSGLTGLNWAQLQALTKTAGNTPQGQLATQYITAVNTLKEEFANLAQGGYAPTEAVWALANKQINENFGVKQMQASLSEIKRLIGYRTQAFDEMKPMLPSNMQNQSSFSSAVIIPDKIKGLKPGQMVDGGDGYIYRINPQTNMIQKAKK